MNHHDEQRPDPDELLRRLKRDEEKATRGRLRIYLGAAPGAGKTYAMLNEGRRRVSRGTDVVVGYVETHGRPLTVQALEGLEVVPRMKVEYHGVVVEEMDTAAVIARHPQVALVDELAHTNAPGSPREKRWEDVEAILAAGITVISTVNVQHLEGLNDVVAGVTGVRVRETVPDRIVDQADEIEVVDISPEALRSRMKHGNIYPPAQAEQALEGFFRQGNLAALREMMLKRAAQDVELQLHQYMREHHLEGWEAGERILVLLDHTPASEVAVRRAFRLAHAFNGELVAAYPATELARQGMSHILTVAMDLNARTIEIPGVDIREELAKLVAEQSVTHVTLVASPPRRIAVRTGPSLAEWLLARHPHLDVHLVLATDSHT